MMAMINTKTVHRSNQLLNYAYGRDFVYDEMMMTGPGPSGEKRAKALVRRDAVQNALIGFAPTRALIRRFVLPKPGQGPSKAARDAGFYDILFIGETSDGRTPSDSIEHDWSQSSRCIQSRLAIECILDARIEKLFELNTTALMLKELGAAR